MCGESRKHGSEGGCRKSAKRQLACCLPYNGAEHYKHVEGKIHGQETTAISQLSSEHEIHPNLIRAWKRQLLEDGPRVFATNGERKQKEQEAQEAELYGQIERLKMELEWLKKVARCGQ